MSDHYKQYPIADERQHSGLGNSSEPIETIKIETFYDVDGRECGSMLTFQGQTHAENWHCGSNPLRDVLFHHGSGRTGSLCPPQGLRQPKVDEGGPAGEVHADRSEDSWQTPVCGDQRGSRLTFPLHVHLKIALCAACFGALVLFFHEIAQVTR